jgi:hypothetical protein
MTVIHEGVRVKSPVAALAAARLELQAASYLLKAEPGIASLEALPGLTSDARGVLVPIASVLAVLAAAAPDAGRRIHLGMLADRLTGIAGELRTAGLGVVHGRDPRPDIQELPDPFSSG